MKKYSLFFTLFVVLGLLLSACGGEEAGLTETPGIELTEDLGEVTPETEVATEPPSVVTGTPAQVETATPAAEETGTPAAGVTGTPALPPTGAEDQPWRLTQLLEFRVLDQNCEQIGEVEGVVFDSVSGNIHYVVVRSEAAPAEAATPTATIAATGTVTATEVVTETAVADLVFVPWSATDLFNPEAAAEEVGTPTAGTPAAGTPTVAATPAGTATTAVATQTAAATTAATATPSGATPAPGVAAGEELCPDEDSAVALIVAQDTFAGAPALSEIPDMTAADWDVDIVAFWTDQVPAPPTSVANPAMIQSVPGILLHGEGGENFGPVVEVIIDTETGQFTHVVFSPGGLLDFGDERVIPLPWAAVEFDADLNQFILTADADEAELEQAPSFPSVNELPDPTEDPDWDQDIDAFWADLTS
jgi:sporulation protein YlmC with PRC-barrel domain